METATVLWGLAGWIFLAIIRTPLLQVMNNLVNSLKALLKLLLGGLDGARKQVGLGVTSLQEDMHGLANGLEEALTPFVTGLSSLLYAMLAHWGRVLATVTEGANSGHQRVLGAFIYMAAMVAFVYADAALGFNTVAAITSKAGLPPPRLPEFLAFATPLLLDITLPLVIAFVGNVAMLGLIFIDLLHITDLAPWPRKGWMQRIFLALVVMNAVFVIFLALGYAMARFAELTPWLDPATARGWFELANFAMNAIAVTALITTWLLWPAVFSVFVLWLVVAGLIIVALGMTRWIVTFLQKVSPLTGNFLAMALGWLGAIIQVILKVFAWVFELVGAIIEIPVKIIEWFVTTITHLPWQLWEWLMRFSFMAHRLKLRPEAASSSVGQDPVP